MILLEKIKLIFIVISLVFVTSPSLAQNSLVEDPSLLSLGVGVFNIVRGAKTTNMQLEYRSHYPFYRNHLFFIRPLLGMMATTSGASYLYGGVAFDIFFTPSIVFTPSFSPGLYLKGGGKDLGFPLEFRSSLELSYRFKNASRFGAMFYHLSNASLGNKNPGTECLVFFYFFPLKFLNF